MKHKMLQDLEALQLALFDIENDIPSDTESLSIRSQVTAATSVQPELPKKRRSRDVHMASKTIHEGSLNLSLVLECLEDMALQESAQIEQCLASVVDTLAGCAAMNTYTISRSGLFPRKTYKPLQSEAPPRSGRLGQQE